MRKKFGATKVGACRPSNPKYLGGNLGKTSMYLAKYCKTKNTVSQPKVESGGQTGRLIGLAAEVGGRTRNVLMLTAEGKN